VRADVEPRAPRREATANSVHPARRFDVLYRCVRALAILLALHGVAWAGTKFTSTWKAPGAAGVSFTGKKVAVLVISKDQDLRVSGEETLAREIGTARGLQTVAAYRLVPREELEDPQKARGWFERAGVEGVIALRPVAHEKRYTYTPDVWAAPYYGTLWGYYGYGWAGAYDPGYVREDTVIVVETMVFSVPQDKLLWAAASETTNPKSTSKFVQDLIKAAVKEMTKEGLIAKSSD
jgi:hypothetical protein